MVYDPYQRDWVNIYCPVCKELLGKKEKQVIDEFICDSAGCSQTKHIFYPGEIERPGKSVPWFSYHHKRNVCGKPCCEKKNQKL